jgi:hypothetical protein
MTRPSAIRAGVGVEITPATPPLLSPRTTDSTGSWLRSGVRVALSILCGLDRTKIAPIGTKKGTRCASVGAQPAGRQDLVNAFAALVIWL